jgi:hypothetical protein
MSAAAIALAMGSGKPPAPPILVRPPLPLPLPRPDRDGVPWATSLPWDSGFAPIDRDYYRGDAWGVVMPGAPMIPGVSSRYPERILSWFVDRYPEKFQHEYLAKYAGYGYTHLTLSPPDSIQGMGFTLAQFKDTCKRVKQYVPYLALNLASKLYQPRDMSPAAFQAYVDPLLDALLDIGDEFVPAWEYDLWNVPGPNAVTIHKHVGDRAHAAGKTCWQHYSAHVTSWFADGDPRGRFGWYDDLNYSTDGINYQGDPNWTTQDACDRAVDTLWQFAQQPYGHKFRYWEDLATLIFDGASQADLIDGAWVARGPGMTPEDADCRGWYLACTYDNVKGTGGKIWGFGNGGRRPDGSRI